MNNINKLQEDSDNYYFYDHMGYLGGKNYYWYSKSTITNIFLNQEFKIYSSLRTMCFNNERILKNITHKVTISKIDLEKLDSENSSEDYIKCYVEEVSKELIKKLVMLL